LHGSPQHASSNHAECAGISRAGSISLNLAASGVAGSTGAIYRTTSHSGSVSLAHLTSHYHGAQALGSSASNGPSHGGESSGNSGNVPLTNSGDSSHLPAPLGAGVWGASSPTQQDSGERPDSASADDAAPARAMRPAPTAAGTSAVFSRSTVEVPEERTGRVLGTVFESETRDTTSSTTNAPEGDSEGLTKPLDLITASMLEGGARGSGDGRGSEGDEDAEGGESGDALLGGYARRSDNGGEGGGVGGSLSPSTAAAVAPSRRRHMWQRAVPGIVPVMPSFLTSTDVSQASQADSGTQDGPGTRSLEPQGRSSTVAHGSGLSGSSMSAGPPQQPPPRS
jgi:hypothetical protein